MPRAAELKAAIAAGNDVNQKDEAGARGAIVLPTEQRFRASGAKRFRAVESRSERWRAVQSGGEPFRAVEGGAERCRAAQNWSGSERCAAQSGAELFRRHVL
jgi:hypothetical protein